MFKKNLLHNKRKFQFSFKNEKYEEFISCYNEGASGEEDVCEEEWLYFLGCLAGRREYNMEEKMSIITKPPHRQA